MQDESIEKVLLEFSEQAKRANLNWHQHQIHTELLEAPHQPSSLPKNRQGVYAFRHQGVWLKVGMAGPKSNARWLSQHYNPESAMSNLAWSLLRYAHYGTREDPRLPSAFKTRLKAVNPSGIGTWIKRNTDRLNILLDAKLGRTALVELERIAQDTLDPVFEGRWKFGGPQE